VWRWPQPCVGRQQQQQQQSVAMATAVCGAAAAAVCAIVAATAAAVCMASQVWRLEQSVNKPAVAVTSPLLEVLSMLLPCSTYALPGARAAVLLLVLVRVMGCLAWPLLHHGLPCLHFAVVRCAFRLGGCCVR
jgi:hypothetical protein